MSIAGRSHLASVIHTAALAAVLLFANGALAQNAGTATGTQTDAAAITTDAQSLMPESGALSQHEYRNAYYNFALELPESFKTIRLRTRPMQRGIHALLGMRFPDPPVTTEIWIAAYDPSSAVTLNPSAAANEMIAALALKREKLGYEPLPIHPEKKGSFQIVEQYKYADKRLILDVFFSRRGHLLKLTAMTTEPDHAGFKAWLLQAIRLGNEGADHPVEGESYFGPTLPDAVVERTIATKPGRNLPADHRIQGANYINNTLALRYRFPFQWKVQDIDSPQQKFFRVDANEAQAAARLHQLFAACSRPLLRLAGKPDSNQTLALLALDPACLQIEFPTKDANSIAEFADILLEYPDFGEVRSAEYTTIQGHPFFVVRSLLPDKAVVDGLRGRMMQTVYITERNGQMLFWFFTARTELAMPTFSVDFTTTK